MNPNPLIRKLKGILRSSENDSNSSCDVTQLVAGQGQAKYYTHADIVDCTVLPPLGDGSYEFHYVGEPEVPTVVNRQNGIWLNVPPSTKTPASV